MTRVAKIAEFVKIDSDIGYLSSLGAYYDVVKRRTKVGGSSRKAEGAPGIRTAER